MAATMESAAAAAFQLRQQHEGRDAGIIVLRCFDGVTFSVPAPLARQRSGLVLEEETAAAVDGETRVVVDVPGNVPGRVVARVIAYWETRAAAPPGSSSDFDGKFLAGLRHDELVDLIHAAYHLRDAALFDLFRSRLRS